MKNFSQKPRFNQKPKFNQKNKNFKKKVFKKEPPKPSPAVTNSVSVIKKNFAKKQTVSASTKLPGIQNFWQAEEKPETNKRSAPDSDDDTSKDQKKQRLTGAERYQRYIDEEERIRKIEDELADPDHDPHTPDQFERALMKDKNSSYMWIKYMAFHLETAETEKARAVAKKAIASINFREEGELLNVWMALLNLEIRYGNDETYTETLREAVQRNDPFKVYSRTLSVLLEMEKIEEATQIIETLKKKFKPMPDMWLHVSEAYLKMKNEKMAKELLPKSMLSLKETERK
jgi:rRNA biogenesis protein RRP5